MGVTIKPILFVGKEFKNEAEALVYVESRMKLTEDDYESMGFNKHLRYLLEERQQEGWPDGGLYSIWDGDENCGFYLGYEVFNTNPTKMMTKITTAKEKWKNLFHDTPTLIQSVLYT